MGPEHEEPEDIWKRVLESPAFKSMQLQGSGGKSLDAELLEAQQILAEAGLHAGEAGYGIAPGFMPPEMRQPPTAGWQPQPSKSELKALGKACGKRLEAGEAKEQLSVISAGLQAADLRVARRA